MSQPAAAGWTVIAHPLFAAQLLQLVNEVAELKAKHPEKYRQKNATKRLAAIVKLAFDEIPKDPTLSAYRQGATLGSDHTHWFRAKFFQQYRLFFRYDQRAKVIVVAWVNDEGTRRAYESKTDAYRVFRKMLSDGNPPDDWNQLVAQAHAGAASTQSALKGAGALLAD
jgi:toxin YhaV